LFEHTEAKGAIKSYENLLAQFDPEIVAAAMISTFLRKVEESRRGPLERPGGYFTKRCREYAANGIPAQILALFDPCQNLPLPEIERYLQVKESQVGGVRQEGLPADEEVPILGRPLSTRDEADRLGRQIVADDSSVTIKQVREVKRGAEVIYVVDILLEGQRCTMASREDWERHFQSVQELKTWLTGMGNRASPCTVT
jgi:hypothetical protein